MKFATLSIENGIVCPIRKMSETDARLELAEAIALPQEFELQIEGERKTRYCAIARRGKRVTHVFFV